MSKDAGYTYHVEPPPDGGSPQDVLTWALQELTKASTVINNLAAGRCELAYKPPPRPRDGMVRMADGTSWDPGGGRGYYGYNSATASWVKLG